MFQTHKWNDYWGVNFRLNTLQWECLLWQNEGGVWSTALVFLQECFLLSPARPLTTIVALKEKKKASFIWRTLTHTAIHESCYHMQRSTGNAVYHFLSVIVCLGLRRAIRLHTESDASEENTHRSCYQTPHMSVCSKTRLSEELFEEREGFGKRGAFHFCFLNEPRAFSQDTVKQRARREVIRLPKVLILELRPHTEKQNTAKSSDRFPFLLMEHLRAINRGDNTVKQLYQPIKWAVHVMWPFKWHWGSILICILIIRPKSMGFCVKTSTYFWVCKLWDKRLYHKQSALLISYVPFQSSPHIIHISVIISSIL